MMTSSKTLSKMGLLLDTKLNWSGHIKMQPWKQTKLKAPAY
jgi:hypothetical protein